MDEGMAGRIASNGEPESGWTADGGSGGRERKGNIAVDMYLYCRC